MSDERIIKRILLFVLLPGALLYVGGKFYAQYHHVDVFVSRLAPMPKELAAGLHMKEHGISSTVQIDSPYETAENKVLSPEEIRRIRFKLAWSTKMPVFVDALYIQSSNQVASRRTTRRFVEECEIIKENGEWRIKRGTRTEIQPHNTFQ